MKIAATYDNGTIFQHFGRTEQFKLYTVEDGKIVSSEVVGNDGLGHEALVKILEGNDIDVLICGGLGPGAMNALEAAGITVIPGAEGSADKAVEAYLKGELQPGEANCDHHDHHEEGSGEGGCGHHGGNDGCGHDEGCGHDCGEGEEEGCGHQCGHCGHHEVILEGKNAGKRVRVHYRGTFNDGTQFDSSYDRGEPMDFVCGTGMMIPGFDKAVALMETGESVDVHLMPEEAYGMPDPSCILHLRIADLPGSEKLSVGDQIYLRNTTVGQSFPVTVTEKDDENITLDANHMLAGKELNFHIELLEVLD